MTCWFWKERCHSKVSRSQYLGVDQARQRETLEAVDRELQRIIENVILRCGTPDLSSGERSLMPPARFAGRNSRRPRLRHFGDVLGIG